MSKGIFSGHIEQIWNNKDVSGIERLIARDYRGFDGAEVISGLEGYKEHFTTVTTGFPDLQITIRDMQEESRVAARFSVKATQTGDFIGVPPTGKCAHHRHRDRRIVNGHLVEEHGKADGLG